VLQSLVNQQEVQCKQGSSLSSADYNYFNPIIDNCDDEDWMSFRDPAKILPILERINTFLVEFRSMSTPTDEVKDVQPKTLTLLIDLLVAFNLKSTVKTSRIETQYRYEYVRRVKSTEHRVVIEGMTDKTIRYNNIPIGTFEDKNTDQDLESYNHKAQAIVEVAAALEQY